MRDRPQLSSIYFACMGMVRRWVWYAKVSVTRRSPCIQVCFRLPFCFQGFNMPSARVAVVMSKIWYDGYHSFIYPHYNNESTFITKVFPEDCLKHCSVKNMEGWKYRSVSVSIIADNEYSFVYFVSFCLQWALASAMRRILPSFRNNF